MNWPLSKRRTGTPASNGHIIEMGAITKEQIQAHPNQKLLTRTLGPKDFVLADVFATPLEPHDRLLLCSDGLTSMVDDEEILSIVLADGRDMKQASSDLVEAANRSGGEDNTTVILLSLHDD